MDDYWIVSLYPRSPDAHQHPQLDLSFIQSVALNCPLCRGPLPPGPKEIFLRSFRKYNNIYLMVKSGRTSWTNLSFEHQREMDEALVVLVEAAGDMCRC